MTREVLRCREVGVSVHGRPILDNVNFSVEAGEFVVLGGPNGAGKSTLLRVLSGELAPTSGDISFQGRALAAHTPLDLARRRAVLTQHASTAFPFVAREVVALGRSPWRDEGKSAAIVDRCMAETGIAALRSRQVHTLSGGEAQRVHFARTLAQLDGAPSPPVLLLDEPTSSLDLAHQHGVLRLARGLADQGAAVVCVLHDLNLAAQYADRLVLLARGAVAAEGAPAAILTPPLLRRLFSLDAVVVPHPTLGFPVVIATGEAESTAHD